MTIGQAIKAARKATGLKQTELAEYLNVSVSSVRKWEQERVLPSAQTVERLCKLLRDSENLMVRLTYDDIVKDIASCYVRYSHG